MSELIQDVKDECGITWDDPATDRKVNTDIHRAKSMLNDYAGEEIDYEADGAAHSLLLTLCRYIYNKATEEFKRNCSEDIVALRQKYEARRALEAEEAVTDDDT